MPTETKQRSVISLLPIDGIDIKERIRLSIELHYEIYIDRNRNYGSSVVYIDGDRISFFHVSDKGVKRYDVTGWDDEKIFYKLSVERSFSMLERFPISWFKKSFVNNGKLYAYSDRQLIVFDVRFSDRIRKLGHFVRADCNIVDVVVLENGNILMCSWYDYEFGFKGEDISYLYLLKDPR